MSCCRILLQTRVALLIGAVLVSTLWTGCTATRYERVETFSEEDATTTREAKKALAANPSFQSVIVTSSNGKVRLSGFVESVSEKQMAYQIVSGLQGVKSVDNQIHVP